MKSRFNMLKSIFSLFIMGSLFVSCSKLKEEKNIYESQEIIKEINAVIKAVLIEDSIYNNFPDFKLVSYLPKFIIFEKKSNVKIGPPPYSDYFYPDIKSEFKGFMLNMEDINFLELQKRQSTRIELSDSIFGDRKSTKVEKTKNSYVYFSLPLFNAQLNLAYLQMGLHCGHLCGIGQTVLLIKKNGKWRIVKRHADWVS